MSKKENEKENKEEWGAGDIPFYGSASRTISITNDIDSETSARFIAQIFQLNAENQIEPIYIHLNTQGGHLHHGMAMYDAIQLIQAPVVILVMGACMSAGLLILSAADLRLTAPNSLFFYHQVILSDLDIESGENSRSIAGYYDKVQTDYDEKIRTRSKISKKIWAKDFAGKTSKFLTPDEALEYGLVDAVLTANKKMKLDYSEEDNGKTRKERPNKRSQLRAADSNPTKRPLRKGIQKRPRTN